MKNFLQLQITLPLVFAITLSLVFLVAQQAQAQTTKEQIIIKNNISKYTDYGEYLKQIYRDEYTPLKAFDNLLPTNQITTTLWSQFGNAGFVVDLKNSINQPVCYAEIVVLEPRNAPFLLTVGDKAVEGKLDSTLTQVNFPECVTNANQIKFDVKSDYWTSIAEIKLYTDNIVPPIEPPVCPPDSYWDEKLKECVAIISPISNGTTIVNSTITLNVSNSTVTVNADETSKVVATTPIGTPLNEEDEDDDDDEQEEEIKIEEDETK